MIPLLRSDKRYLNAIQKLRSEVLQLAMSTKDQVEFNQAVDLYFWLANLEMKY